MGPTDSGQFVIAYCSKHSSRRYAEWSKIKWGTPLKEENGQLFIKFQGQWKLLKNYTSVTKDQIKQYHRQLYGTAKIPTQWVFNDFGHMTCYYFKDINKNRKLDKSAGERVHGEFIHTTPTDEANTRLGLPVFLTESHGCVHVKPADIDIMIEKGYLRKGNLFIVHKYNEAAPTVAGGGNAKPPYEVHFYPGSRQIVVKGTAIK